jgi:predicted transcriptional regulator
MPRAQTIVQLTDDLIRLLDAEAGRRGTSRSALIREAVSAYLADSREAMLAAQVVDGYRRIPPGTPDGWADLETLADDAVDDTLGRLDEEERRPGFEPW